MAIRTYGPNAVDWEERIDLDRLRSAAPTHLRGVSEHVTSRLTAEELDQLKVLMLKLGDGPLEPPAGGCGAAEGVS